MNVKFVKVTLTVKFCREEFLEEQVDALREGFSRFLNDERIREFFQGRFLEEFHCPVCEFESLDTFEPHFHCVFAVRKRITSAELATLWQQALGVDYLPVVLAEKVYFNTFADPSGGET